MHGHTVSTGVIMSNRRERTEGGQRGRHTLEFETKCSVTLYTHHGSTQNLDGLAAVYLGLVRYGSMGLGTSSTFLLVRERVCVMSLILLLVRIFDGLS